MILKENKENALVVGHSNSLETIEALGQDQYPPLRSRYDIFSWLLFANGKKSKSCITSNSNMEAAAQMMH
jgi:hypothetical protein